MKSLFIPLLLFFVTVQVALGQVTLVRTNTRNAIELSSHAGPEISVAEFMAFQNAPFHIVSRIMYYGAGMDSTWQDETYEIVPIEGRPTAKLARVLEFRYAASDSIREDISTDGGTTNRDTLIQDFYLESGQWKAARRQRTRYHDRGWIRTEEEGTPMILHSVQHHGRIQDGLGRTVFETDSVYFSADSTWPGTIDSTWYQGSSRVFFRKARYNPMDLPLGGRTWVLSSAQDSMEFDAENRPTKALELHYNLSGSISEYIRQTWHYQGDTVFTYTTMRSPALGSHDSINITQRQISVDFGDSARSYSATLRGSVWQTDGRMLVRFLLPTTYPRSWGYDTKTELWNDTLGWVVTNLARRETSLNQDGSPRRRITYEFTPFSGLQPHEKIDYEFYSLELLPAKVPLMIKFIHLSPNPAASALTIQSSPPISHLLFINAVGQQFPVSVDGNRATIGHLPKGLYYATAYSQGKAVGTSRIVKE